MPSSPPHGHALRKGRCSEIGRAYLLTSVIENRRPLFLDLRVGRFLVTEMRAEVVSGRIESMAWVVMPDHLHWLVTLRQGNLDDLMRRVKSRSAIVSMLRLAKVGGYGRRDITITHSAPTRLCRLWRDMWWQIHCVRVW